MTRRGARQPGGFYGWHVTGFAAVLLMATAPGQTAGVSAFIDPMIADLGADRTPTSSPKPSPDSWQHCSWAT